MRDCILHVGMHKTGSSSIQEWLYFGPEDPAFQFVSLGQVNGSGFLETMFGDRPAAFWRSRGRHLTTATVEGMRQDLDRRFRKALRRANERCRTPIISAERCWTMPAASLERLRDLLLEEGFEARVIAYIRPIRTYAESHFTESFRSLRIASLDPASLGLDGAPGLARWSRRLELLERVFGRRRLTLRLFCRSSLLNGCVVQDFCRTIGRTSENVPMIRTRASLSVDAVRLLWAHQRFLPAATSRTLFDRALLAGVLAELEGDRLSFHDDVFAPVAGEVAREERAIRDRYGIDLSEHRLLPRSDACIRKEDDLLRYSRTSLDWLAAMSRSKPIAGCEGESVAREGAAQVGRIGRVWFWRQRAAQVRTRLRTRLRWIMRGD